MKTALCLVESLAGQMASHLETSQVIFRHLSDDEIWIYIQSGERLDKAGSYAIQGLGGKFVEQFIGEYDNIVVLTVNAFEKLLAEEKWSVERVKR